MVLNENKVPQGLQRGNVIQLNCDEGKVPEVCLTKLRRAWHVSEDRGNFVERSQELETKERITIQVITECC